MISFIIMFVIIALALAVVVGIVYYVYKNMGVDIAISLSGLFFFGGIAAGLFVGFVDKFFGRLFSVLTFQSNENPIGALPLLIIAIILGLVAFGNGKRLIRLLNEL